MFGVLEDHINGLFLQDNLLERRNILVVDLPVELTAIKLRFEQIHIENTPQSHESHFGSSQCM